MRRWRTKWHRRAFRAGLSLSLVLGALYGASVWLNLSLSISSREYFIESGVVSSRTMGWFGDPPPTHLGTLRATVWRRWPQTPWVWGWSRVQRFVVPLWMPLGSALALTAWAWSRGRAYGIGMCAACGYDLNGVASGVCPECGQEEGA